jgi:hypothetical protein
MHFPLTDSSLPTQKNFLHMASISFLAQGGKLSAIMEYIGTALSTDLIQTNLPLRAMSEPWQGGIFLATASTMEWIAAFGIFFGAQR